MYAEPVARGSSPTDPGAMTGIFTNIYSERTGAYVATGLRLFGIIGGGVPDTLYGLRIAAHTQGAVDSWNILSEGTASKNKFQGRVFEGTPNSPPTDAHLDNGMISAYLDQSGNKIKWRAKYSDGTLKTGEVALT